MRNWVTGVMIVLSFLLITCKDKGIEIIDNTLPGRRDYTWTVDTLKANPGDQINLSSLWGSSPSDVWAVGSADASNLAKWHYNGTAWKLDSLRLSSNLSSVFGFAQDNVWACDAPDGNILHYDGKSWMKFGKYSLPGYPFLYLVDIWGASPDDVYCVGAAAISGGAHTKESSCILMAED
ncbi:MAG: hypothetical protein HY277_03775, partial [Ignavibacteriales bacterium]|nr:hypothetical protein [Ignavibacteriales bacterium]